MTEKKTLATKNGEGNGKRTVVSREVGVANAQMVGCDGDDNVRVGGCLDYRRGVHDNDHDWSRRRGHPRNRVLPGAEQHRSWGCKAEESKGRAPGSAASCGPLTRVPFSPRRVTAARNHRDRLVALLRMNKVLPATPKRSALHLDIGMSGKQLVPVGDGPALAVWGAAGALIDFD